MHLAALRAVLRIVPSHATYILLHPQQWLAAAEHDFRLPN
jgi:hypothetical protein